MPEEPSNAVIVAKLEALVEVVHNNALGNKEEHRAIFEQTSKTNGRVTSLEKSKNMLIGALIFMNVIIVPIALSVINKWLNSK